GLKLRHNFKYAANAARREAAYTCCIRHIHAMRDSGLCPLWFKTVSVLNLYDYITSTGNNHVVIRRKSRLASEGEVDMI
ncbi:MAG: hypothetical protein LBV27_02250, partial [Oscillospiraceae bacterium]|nr:hypothetical protein [Oscillospiraceae bacterium]